MTHGTWHMAHDTWHMTHDTWHMTLHGVQNCKHLLIFCSFSINSLYVSLVEWVSIYCQYISTSLAASPNNQPPPWKPQIFGEKWVRYLAITASTDDGDIPPVTGEGWFVSHTKLLVWISFSYHCLTFYKGSFSSLWKMYDFLFVWFLCLFCISHTDSLTLNKLVCLSISVWSKTILWRQENTYFKAVNRFWQHSV